MLCWVSALILAPAGLSATTENLNIDGKSFKVSVVRASLDQYRVRVGLAKGRMGKIDSLDSIARQYGADVAINGCFFDAYSNKAFRSIDHLVVSEGTLLHFTNRGSAFGIKADGKPFFGRPRWKIRGLCDRKPWYAYWLNRYPTGSTTITVYTPEWGTATGVDGLQVTVEGGRAASISRYSSDIPRKGFVILFAGDEEKATDKFKVGSTVSYEAQCTTADGEDWMSASEALGCGPLLLNNGADVLDVEGEGFSDLRKSGSAARSFVGTTASREIVFGTCTATPEQETAIAKKLGCTGAMNLDGGASSGLWTSGKWIRKPGRQVANALLLIKR